LSLPVLADPFWLGLPWLLKRRSGKTASKGRLQPIALVCALGLVEPVLIQEFHLRVEFHDI
jgi:hypothetical protein